MDGFAECFAEATRLAYNLLLPFVLMPRFLGLFWWIKQIIYKYTCQQKATLGVIQNKNCNIFIVSRLAPFGTTWIISVCRWNKSRNKCNIETKNFFLSFPFWMGKIILLKMEERKGEKEGMENRAPFPFLFCFLDLSFFLIGLKTDLFCKEEPITCGKHVPGLSSMTAGFQYFQHLCKAMNDSWFKWFTIKIWYSLSAYFVMSWYHSRVGFMNWQWTDNSILK